MVSFCSIDIPSAEDEILTSMLIYFILAYPHQLGFAVGMLRLSLD
jgi:hypothetical protein